MSTRAASNVEWRYHHAEADDAAGIDFEKYGRNGFELCGLTSHAGKLVAVFKRNPTAKDGVARATRKAKRARGAGRALDAARGSRGRFLLAPGGVARPGIRPIVRAAIVRPAKNGLER